MEVSLQAFRDMALEAMKVDQSGDTVIRLGKGAQVLSAESWTRLGSRTAAEKEGNLATRRAFMEAFKNEVGDLQLDKKTADSLKLYDFMINQDGAVMSNRPLTARRILALTEAIKPSRVQTAGLAEMEGTLRQIKNDGQNCDSGEDNPRRVVASLNAGQMRQLSAILCKKAQVCIDKASHLDGADKVKKSILKVVRGEDVLWDQLAKLMDSKMSSAAVSRFLDVLEHAPDTDKGALGRLMKAIHKTSPEKFDSPEQFAEELKARLGRKIQIPPEASGNLKRIIGVLGRQMANDLSDYWLTATNIGLDKKFHQAADKACQKACKHGLINKDDVSSCKESLKYQLLKCCRENGRLFVTEADVKVSLFGVICDRQIHRLDEGEPRFNLLLDDDFAKKSQKIGETDYGTLFQTINDFCLRKNGQYEEFRKNRDGALAAARNEIRKLGELFELKLTDSDINMSSVQRKFKDTAITKLATVEAVSAIVKKKKFAGLEAFAAGLVKSKRFSQEEKASLFLTFCKAPSVPPKTFERLEDMVGVYEDDFSKVIQEELEEVEDGIKTLSDNKKDISARSNELNERLLRLTQSLASCVFKPIEKHTSQGEEYGADEATDLLNVLGSVIRERNDDRLSRFALFAVHNKDYQAWTKLEGNDAVGMDLGLDRLVYLASKGLV